jgi:hypothetical protein
MPERLEITLVRELEIAYSNGTPVAVVRRASPYQWANACHDLFEAGRIDILEFAVRYLHKLYPDLRYLRTLLGWFDSMPRDMPAPLAFCDDPKAEVQVVQRPDCDAVLFCFCAGGGTLGLPVNFVHHWLGRVPASLVYIKDLRELWGGCGFPALGPDRASAIKELRHITQVLNVQRIYTFGVSHGGYPALYYGLELGAVGVLNLGGSVDLTPSFVDSLGPMRLEYKYLCEVAPEYLINLRDSYESAGQKPRVYIAYSARYPDDRRQAERMAGLPNVELIAVNHAQHNVLEPLIQTRAFMPLLERLLATGYAA